MRLASINLLAIIIALTSIIITHSEVKLFTVGSDSYQTVPLQHQSPLNTPTGKSDSRLSYIAQDFIPIVAIASFEYDIKNYSYYLPYYSLTVEKEYFLLL